MLVQKQKNDHTLNPSHFFLFKFMKSIVVYRALLVRMQRVVVKHKIKRV